MTHRTPASDASTALVAALAALGLAVAGVAAVAGWQVARGTAVLAAVVAWLALGAAQGVETTANRGETGGRSA